MTTDPDSFAVLVARYIDWMGFRNYAPKSITNRQTYLGYFVTWCEERGIIKPAEVTRPIIERYQRYLYHYRKPLSGEPLSFRSQHVRLVTVRAFFKWLARKHYLLHNPASELELPRLEKRLPKHVLTVSEVEQVLTQPNLTEPLGIRDRAILETFYSTGIRRMELINLSLYDLDGDRGTLLVRQGKGRKDRMVPIGDRALAWIDKYLSEVRPELVITPDQGFMFLANHGQQFTPDRMTQLVRGYIDQADIGKRGSCHLFRHTMATLMLENGADIRFIQMMLGHAELSTTQIYTQVSIRKLKEVHSLTHPARLEPPGRSKE